VVTVSISKVIQVIDAVDFLLDETELFFSKRCLSIKLPEQTSLKQIVHLPGILFLCKWELNKDTKLIKQVTKASV
jgi:hypothetical protein